MTIIQDIRLAFRLLRRNPPTTAIALVSIALSVAATCVMFAAIKSVLITPMPYAHTERLVQIRTEFANEFEPSIVDFGFWNDAQEIARRTRTLDGVGAYANAIYNLLSGDSTPPEALYGLRVSANLFPVLGVKPMLGRNILADEDQPGHANEMILSYGLWVRRFNSDRNIVGHSVNVDGHDCLIIGVMPPEFNFPLRRAAAHTPSPYVEFWAPIRIAPITAEGGVGIVARLRNGISLRDAEEDLATISTALTREFPASYRDRTLRLGLLRDRTLGDAAKSLWLLMVAACMFLLIGCANVANLLLARGVSRQREIAIRVAVGASSGRLIRQLLTEGCVLASWGGIGGYLLTVAAWRILPALAPVSIPRLASARADWPVLAFALAVALINGILFGMAPAVRAGSTPAFAARDSRALHGTPSRSNRMRSTLVIAEVAITVTLVVVGGQLLTSFIEVIRTEPGFDADHLLASVVVPSAERYRTRKEKEVVYKKFLDAVRAIPGIESAGTVDALPFSGENHGGLITGAETQVIQPSTQIPAEIDVVSSDYLQTMGVHLTQGRWFREDEMNERNDAVIISDVAAARLWRGADAIGKRICVYCTPENPNNWKNVIGVVSTIRHRALDDPQLNVYLTDGALENAAFLVVRVNRPFDGMKRAIRLAIASVDPNTPVFLSASMRALIGDSIADRRFIVTLLGATGFLALIMSAAGVYGVVSYVTSRRTQEIGLRIALGATRGNVRLLVFSQGFTTVAVGMAAGTLLTLVLLRVLRGVVTGLEPGNLWQILVSLALVSLTAAIACWAPARRATKVDPMVALRYE